MSSRHDQLVLPSHDPAHIRALTFRPIIKYTARGIDFQNGFQPRTARSVALLRVTAPYRFRDRQWPESRRHLRLWQRIHHHTQLRERGTAYAALPLSRRARRIT